MKWLSKLIGVVLLCMVSSLSAQSVRYDVEPGIRKIQEDYIARWGKVRNVEGYRIQIMAISGSNARTRMESAKANIKADYPSLPVYATYQEPYFRIRVGDFTNRIDAYRMLQRILPQYPSAYIIADQIEY
ncbi:MAG: SPOR domain-containing protein [Bacteroidales bacterium]|nr:SPOR domain-containing protein [Bacteroidales bacterium]